jgi:hypothetical protein
MIHNKGEQDEKGSLKELGDNNKTLQKPEHACQPAFKGKVERRRGIGQSHNSHNSPMGKFECRNARYGS